MQYERHTIDRGAGPSSESVQQLVAHLDVPPTRTLISSRELIEEERNSIQQSGRSCEIIS